MKEIYKILITKMCMYINKYCQGLKGNLIFLIFKLIMFLITLKRIVYKNKFILLLL